MFLLDLFQDSDPSELEMPSEEVNYVQRVDRMLNRWAGVKSTAQPKDRTRVEIGKESQNDSGDSFEVSTNNQGNATVVIGELIVILMTSSYSTFALSILGQQIFFQASNFEWLVQNFSSKRPW